MSKVITVLVFVVVASFLELVDAFVEAWQAGVDGWLRLLRGR